MSDIDFDELDRAVTGALNGTPAATPKSQPDELIESLDTIETLEPIQRTSLASSRGSAPVSAPVPEPATTIDTPEVTRVINPPVTAPAAPRPSSGRFMDIVHPSSDMRSNNNEVVRPFEKKPEITPTVEPVAEPVTYDAPAWNEPLESPFLPDTKVEKRPLGGSGLLEAPEPQELLEPLTMPDPIDFAQSQAIIEPNEPEVIITEEPVVEEVVELEIPVEPELVVQEQLKQVEDLPSPVFVEQEPVGPTSITQQYKEQVSTNQESGAIYDTESYHQPVTKPVKKSGNLAILWIALLVVFGAAAGWAVYTFILPML